MARAASPLNAQAESCRGATTNIKATMTNHELIENIESVKTHFNNIRADLLPHADAETLASAGLLAKALNQQHMDENYMLLALGVAIGMEGIADNLIHKLSN